jgi:hypothetical protein
MRGFVLPWLFSLLFCLFLASCGGTEDTSANSSSVQDPFAASLKKQTTEPNREIVDVSTYRNPSPSFQSGTDPFKNFLDNQNKSSN